MLFNNQAVFVKILQNPNFFNLIMKPDYFTKVINNPKAYTITLNNEVLLQNINKDRKLQDLIFNTPKALDLYRQKAPGTFKTLSAAKLETATEQQAVNIATTIFKNAQGKVRENIFNDNSLIKNAISNRYTRSAIIADSQLFNIALSKPAIRKNLIENHLDEIFTTDKSNSIFQNQDYLTDLMATEYLEKIVQNDKIEILSNSKYFENVIIDNLTNKPVIDQLLSNNISFFKLLTGNLLEQVIDNKDSRDVLLKPKYFNKAIKIAEVIGAFTTNKHAFNALTEDLSAFNILLNKGGDLTGIVNSSHFLPIISRKLHKHDLVDSLVKKNITRNLIIERAYQKILNHQTAIQSIVNNTKALSKILNTKTAIEINQLILATTDSQSKTALNIQLIDFATSEIRKQNPKNSDFTVTKKLLKTEAIHPILEDESFIQLVINNPATHELLLEPKIYKTWLDKESFKIQGLNNNILAYTILSNNALLEETLIANSEDLINSTYFNSHIKRIIKNKINTLTLFENEEVNNYIFNEKDIIDIISKSGYKFNDFSGIALRTSLNNITNNQNTYISFNKIDGVDLSKLLTTKNQFNELIYKEAANNALSLKSNTIFDAIINKIQNEKKSATHPITQLSNFQEAALNYITNEDDSKLNPLFSLYKDDTALLKSSLYNDNDILSTLWNRGNRLFKTETLTKINNISNLNTLNTLNTLNNNFKNLIEKDILSLLLIGERKAKSMGYNTDSVDKLITIKNLSKRYSNKISQTFNLESYDQNWKEFYRIKKLDDIFNFDSIEFESRPNRNKSIASFYWDNAKNVLTVWPHTYDISKINIPIKRNIGINFDKFTINLSGTLNNAINKNNKNEIMNMFYSNFSENLYKLNIFELKDKKNITLLQNYLTTNFLTITENGRSQPIDFKQDNDLISTLNQTCGQINKTCSWKLYSGRNVLTNWITKQNQSTYSAPSIDKLFQGEDALFDKQKVAFIKDKNNTWYFYNKGPQNFSIDFSFTSKYKSLYQSDSIAELKINELTIDEYTDPNLAKIPNKLKYTRLDQFLMPETSTEITIKPLKSLLINGTYSIFTNRSDIRQNDDGSYTYPYNDTYKLTLNNTETLNQHINSILNNMNVDVKEIEILEKFSHITDNSQYIIGDFNHIAKISMDSTINKYTLKDGNNFTKNSETAMELNHSDGFIIKITMLINRNQIIDYVDLRPITK